MSIARGELEKYLNELLLNDFITDYGPNGLQIEGRAEIKKVAFAVTASQFAINAAIENKCDTLIVHHGLFWNFHGPKTITGPFAKRVIPLIKNDLNLFGFHLPLDGHPKIGNAVLLGQALGLEMSAPFGEYKRTVTGAKGKFLKPLSARELKQRLELLLKRAVVLSSPDEDMLIQTVGIITGGANSNWIDAYQQGLDAYITGEMSEHDWHDSKECGVHMFAAGHNATEEFGIKGLMKKIENDLALECIFISSQNPI